MGDFNVWAYLAKMGTSLKAPGHQDFREGDRVTKINRSIVLTLEDVEEFLHVDYKQFTCQVPGCKETFSQLHQSESHYNAVHRHSCSVCRKSLPSPHLLELHIQEQHDSFFSILAEKKASYQCFLPTCSVVSWNPEERHDHAIKEHKFPPDFRFDQVKRRNGNKRGDKSKRNDKSASDNTKRPLSLARLDSNIEEEINHRNSLCILGSPESTAGSGKKSRIPVLRSNSCRVPRNISFGAGIPRAFEKNRSKHWHQQNVEPMDTTVNIEKVDLDILKAALPT